VFALANASRLLSRGKHQNVVSTMTVTIRAPEFRKIHTTCAAGAAKLEVLAGETPRMLTVDNDAYTH
jgi:hypothetical protein